MPGCCGDMVERESNSTMPIGEEVDSDIDVEIGSFELSFPSMQMDAAASPARQVREEVI